MRIGRLRACAPLRRLHRSRRAARSRGWRLLSWGRRPFQRHGRRVVARSWVPRSPFAVGLAASALGSSELADAARRSKDSRARPLRGLPPLQSLTGPASRRSLERGASPGVPAPSAHSGAGSHSSGICLVPVPVRLQGFSPSCRLHPPAPIQPVKAGGAHGVLPFEASPSDGAVAPLDARCPPAVSPSSALPRPVRATEGRGRSRLQGVAPRRSPSRPAGVSRSNARCSPGVPPLQGSSGSALPSASRRLPSQASPSAPKSVRRPLRVSIRDPVGFHCAPIRRLLHVKKPRPSCGSHTSSRFRALRARLHSWLTPTGPAASLPLRRPSSERPRTLPQGSRSEFRCQAPGRHPTLKDTIPAARTACQIIVGVGLTSWPPESRKPFGRPRFDNVT